MNCSNCGNYIAPGESFCCKCGMAAAPAPVYGGGAPVTTVAGNKVGALKQKVPYIIMAALFVFMLICWFFNHFEVEIEKESLYGYKQTYDRDVSMGKTVPVGYGGLFAFTFLFVPLNFATIVISVVCALSKTPRKEGYFVQIAASACNILAFFVSLIVYAAGDDIESVSVIGGGYVFIIFAFLALAGTLFFLLCPNVLDGVFSEMGSMVNTVESAERPFNYSGAPAGYVPTVKCGLCGYDVPVGNSFCVQCGTALSVLNTPPAASPPYVPAEPVYDNSFPNDPYYGAYGPDDKTMAVNEMRAGEAYYGEAPVAPPPADGGFVGKVPEFGKTDSEKPPKKEIPNVWHKNSGF